MAKNFKPTPNFGKLRGRKIDRDEYFHRRNLPTSATNRQLCVKSVLRSEETIIREIADERHKPTPKIITRQRAIN